MLIKETLTTALYNTLKNQYEGELTTDQNTRLNSLASDLSDCFDNYIRSMVITVPAGIPLVASGYPGATTAPSQATIS
jgi:hypothetical protein